MSIETGALPERRVAVPRTSSAGVISWGAIWAGAATSIAASLVLTLAAAGLGVQVAFPGLESGASLKAFTPVVGAYAMVVQVLCGALGGYVVGRLRSQWDGVHADESHFRDTAHGLIVWAVATLGGVLLAAEVLVPYAQQMASMTTPIGMSFLPVSTPEDVQRAKNIFAQASLFLAIGLLLSAFVSAVAARLGGLQAEGMHAKRTRPQ